MNVKIKETEKYKWIYQEEYDNWFKNRDSINNANIYHFVAEILNNKVCDTYSYFNHSKHLSIFMNNNGIYNSRRRNTNKNVFVTSGVVFSNNHYEHAINLHNYDLIVLQVIDKETNNIKFLVKESEIKSGIIKELKTTINSNRFNSRKDVIVLDTLSDFIETFEIDDNISFDKVQEEYCKEHFEETLLLLKEAVKSTKSEELESTSEQLTLVEESNENNNELD